jgi:hypothetical protein
MKKLQAPSTNIQRSSNVQAPTRAPRAGDLVFEVWRLKFLWSLDVGVWSFSK